MKSILDEKGRLFKVINLLDLAIVLIILVAVLIIAPYFTGKKAVNAVDTSTQKTVFFTVEFPQTTQEFADKITLDDAIKDNAREYYYGVVSDIEVKQSKIITEDKVNGKFVESEVPNFVDVLVTVKCNGTESEDEILAEGQPIKFGKLMVLKGKGYAGAGYVVKLLTE